MLEILILNSQSVQHIDEFNFKMYKIFLRGGGHAPDPPRGTEVHPPQSHKILWETLIQVIVTPGQCSCNISYSSSVLKSVWHERKDIKTEHMKTMSKKHFYTTHKMIHSNILFSGRERTLLIMYWISVDNKNVSVSFCPTLLQKKPLS